MLDLNQQSITKGGVHFTPNPVYTLPGILNWVLWQWEFHCILLTQKESKESIR